MRLVLLCAAVFLSLPPYSSVRAGEPNKRRHDQIELGPFVSYTINAQWPRNNISYKGLAIRLKKDGQDKGGIVYDTDLLRVATGWTGGFVSFERDVASIRDYRSVTQLGTQSIGSFQRPGVARPGANDFADPRTQPFGPLPRDWAKYKGLYLHGDNVVVSYKAGASDVLELPAYETLDQLEAITRTMQFTASPKALTFLLTERDDVQSDVRLNGKLVVLKRAAAAKNEAPGVKVIASRVEDNWEQLSIGGPSRADFASVRANTVVFKPVAGFAAPGGKFPKPEIDALPQLLDSGAAVNYDDANNNIWFDGGQGRIVADLKRPVSVRQVDSFSWGRNDRAPQLYTLYGSDAETEPAANGADPAASGWKLISKVDTRAQGNGGMHGVSIQSSDGKLGKFQYLLFVVDQPGKVGTYFCEIDIFSTIDPPKFPDMSLPEGQVTAVALVGDTTATLLAAGRSVLLHVPANTAGALKVVTWTGTENLLPVFEASVDKWSKPADLMPLTKGGPRRWNQELTTQGRLSTDDKKAYVVDTITLPEENPWKAWMRPGGFDFFSDPSKAALSNWSGDVWTVSGIDEKLEKLMWQRIATGLFNPLGLRIVKDQVYVLGRDQLTRLHDLNGDGETDFYENFNNDMMATWNFHEFAFDLQSDSDGNFYFTKGGPVRNAGHGFERIAEHHGAMLKVSADGQQLERIATGLRAPNGMSVSPDGSTFTSGDNEGTWVPQCRLNWIKPGAFCGVMDTAHRAQRPATYDPPLCWMPKEADNSSGGQVWVTSDQWGPFKNELLHLSYGTCSLNKVLYEIVDGTPQGGIVRFPLAFDAGIMRARFNARDGQLYVCGLKGWQTTAARDGCFQRVRFTGKPVVMPTQMHAGSEGLSITFTAPLDKTAAADPESYSLEQWNYLYSEAYGSAEYSVANPQEKKRDTVDVKAVKVSADGKTVLLQIPNLKPVMQLKLSFNLDAADGSRVNYTIYGTINKLK